MAAKNTFGSGFDRIFIAASFLLEREFVTVYLQTLGHFSRERFLYDAIFNVKLLTSNVTLR